METDFCLNDDSLSVMTNQTKFKNNNLNDSNNYSVSMMSVISKTELAKNQKKDVHQRIQSYASSPGHGGNNKSKMNLFLSSVFRDNNDEHLNINISRDIRLHFLKKENLSSDEIEKIEDDLIGKIVINKIDDITLFKENSQNNTLNFFYAIKGEITQIQKNDEAFEEESENNQSKFYKTTYDRIEIALIYFNNEQNKNIFKLQPNLFDMLQYYSNFFPRFSKVGERFLLAYENVLKYVDIRSFLVFVLENQYNFDINSIHKETLENSIKEISINDLSANVEKYIIYLISEFQKQVVPYESYNNIYELLNSILIDVSKLSSFISSIPTISSFTLVRNLEEIRSNIESFFILQLDKSPSNMNIIKNYTESSVNDNNDKDERIKEYHHFIEKIFYSLIIKINEYTKSNLPMCCGFHTNSKEINYCKAPYVYCFNCAVIVCKKCFINHKSHNYFDIACTLKNKIGNIHSEKDVFLNNKHHANSKNKSSPRYAEDLIMNLILKYISFNLDEHLKEKLLKSNNNKNSSLFSGLATDSNIFNLLGKSLIQSTISEKINISIFNILDILLFEFLFKTIYPLLENENYLTYELNIQMDSSREDSLISILLMDAVDSSNEKINTLTKVYMNNISHKKENSSQKEAKQLFDCISLPINGFNQEDYMVEEKEMIVEDEQKGFYNEHDFKQTDNFFHDCTHDFEQVIDNYMKFREKLTLYDEDNENNIKRKDGINNEKNENDKIIKKDLEFILKDMNSEKKISMDEFIKEKVNQYEEFEKTLNYVMKWYYLYNNNNLKRTEIRYINGLGTLYSYSMNYLENILLSIANYGTFKNGIDKDEIITVTQDDFE